MAKVPLPPDKNDARATDRRNVWFSAPQLWTIIGGLVTAAIGAVITGGLNIRLEDQKFQGNLIQKALEAKDDNEKLNNLTFLAKIDLIDDDRVRLVNAALPSFLGAAIRDRLITVGEAKKVLVHLGMHKGPTNDDVDDNFRKEIAEFQLSRGIEPDGYIGPKTYAKLREAWPQFFIPDFLTVREAQNVLAHLVPSLHTGPLNDVADEAFRKEIEAFQKKRGIPLDG